MIAIGCDHGAVDLKISLRNIWIRKELHIKILDAIQMSHVIIYLCT